MKPPTGHTKTTQRVRGGSGKWDLINISWTVVKKMSDNLHSVSTYLDGYGG